MPIYEFKCQDEDECGKVFEKLAPMDTKKIECPKCGTEAVKIPSVPGEFQMAGKTPRHYRRTA